MRAILACAGTGGHINPAIAIANIIMKNEPDSVILFIGTKTGLENEIVTKSGYNIKHIRSGKIIRSLTLKNIKGVIDAYMGISDAKKILKEFRADIVIGTGGYICVPVMLAAKKLKIPYVLHESNAFPGISVKLLAKNASKVLIGFKEAASRIKLKTNVTYTGTPAKFSKEDMFKLDRLKCKSKLGLGFVEKKILLVTCGSQGAVKINNIVMEMIEKKLSEEFFVVLVTGKRSYNDILLKKQEIENRLKVNLDNYLKIEEFVYNMEEMYKAADVCLTRSGAMTITELSIASKPSILIPLPSAAENHQLYNAKVLENVNAAKIIEEKDLNVDHLYDTILSILNNNNQEIMSRNAQKVIEENVDENIYKCISDVLKK